MYSCHRGSIGNICRRRTSGRFCVLINAIVLTVLIIFAFIMKLFERFTHNAATEDTIRSAVENAGYTFKGKK